MLYEPGRPEERAEADETLHGDGSTAPIGQNCPRRSGKAGANGSIHRSEN